MDKTFRAFDPHQALLLPPSLDDWRPEDHLARFVTDLVPDFRSISRFRRRHRDALAGFFRATITVGVDSA